MIDFFEIGWLVGGSSRNNKKRKKNTESFSCDRFERSHAEVIIPSPRAMGRCAIWWENHPRALYARFVCVVIGFLALHLVDMVLDVLVIVDLWKRPGKMYAWVACFIMLVGSISQSIVGAFLSNAGKSMRDFDKEGAEKYNIRSAHPLIGAILGFTPLGIVVEAAYSLKAGVKTQGFATARVLEAVVEAGPQSLLQLFIALSSLQPGSTDHTDTILLLASPTISILSMAAGLGEYEKVVARIGLAGHGTGEARAQRLYARGDAAGDPLYMSFASPYFVCVWCCRACEVAARMCTSDFCRRTLFPNECAAIPGFSLSVLWVLCCNFMTMQVCLRYSAPRAAGGPSRRCSCSTGSRSCCTARGACSGATTSGATTSPAAGSSSGRPCSRSLASPRQ